MKILRLLAGMESSLKEALDPIPKSTTVNFTAIFNWAITLAGLVAAGFIVYSAVNYVLSEGEPAKIQKARQGLLYSMIGLMIVILTAAIINFLLASLKK